MKRLPIAVAGMLALATSHADAQVRDTMIKLDAIVAVVGNVAITAYDVERRLADSLAVFQQRGAGMPTKQVQAAMVSSALNDLVDEEVLLLKAKEAGIEVSDAEISTPIENMMKEVSGRYPSPQAFRQALADAGYGTPEEYRRVMTTTLRRERTLQQYIGQLRQERKMPSVVVPESKVLEEFERLKAAGMRKRATTVSWRQMVIAPAPSAAAKAVAKAKADSLRTEIRAGADFERVAKRESMDAATKDLGGDLGWRKRGDLPIELERYLFGPLAIRQGEISSVIESPFGFHLLRLDRANPPAEVKVRQILIIPRIDSTDILRAKQLSDSLLGVLRGGVSFDTIARLFHDRAEDAPGLIPEMPIDSLPSSYQAGLKDVKKDSIVAFPIQAPTGYEKVVIAQVSSTSEPGEYTYDELKQRIRFQLQQVLQTRKFIDQQRKTVFVQLYPERAQEATRIFAGPPGQ
ncbi:MAG TPA: peptidylprolyl isomerase [Gemmatimonadaceae bacterium]|nr:peptidylprolyl isomerase [Gemmatimonadaceae bacterium]